ncbi:MAG: MFS transporter, partial [Nocardioidaceae bacterium]|nr:MFS transporter [Nocardioidaceae bacterium]
MAAARNANEMGYRQAGTPDELKGRLNTTMRSVNRAIVVCEPVGGLLAYAIGYWPT